MVSKKIDKNRSIAKIKSLFLTQHKPQIINKRNSKVPLKFNNKYKVSKIRNQIKLNELEEIITWLKSQSYLFSLIHPTNIPRSYLQLEPNDKIYPHTCEFEIRWTAMYLSDFACELKIFCNLKEKFEIFLLQSDYKSCHKILNEIELRLGISFWLISNKLALFQLDQGLEFQKIYLKQVTGSGVAGGYVNFLSYYLSYKNEPTTIPSSFYSNINYHIDNLNIKEEYKYFSKYILIPSYRFSDKAIASALHLSSSSSIIDGYQALIFFSKSIINSQKNSLLPSVKFGIGKIAQQLKDKDLDIIRFALGDDNLDLDIDNESLDIYEEFLVGKFEEVEKRLSTAIFKKPAVFDLWEIAAKTIILHKKSLNLSISNDQYSGMDRCEYLSNIIASLSNVINRTDLNSDSLTITSKAAFSFNTLNWSQSLIGFLTRELSSEPIGFLEEESKFGAMFQNTVHPLRLFSTDESLQTHYLKYIKSKVPNELSQSYSKLLATNDITDLEFNNLRQNIKKDEFSYLCAEASYKFGKFEDCLSFSDLLIASETNFYRYKGIRFKSNCLLKTSVPECVKFVSKIIVETPELHSLLPLKKLVKSITESDTEMLRNDLSLSVLYDFYLVYVNEDYKDLIAYSYENFLDSYQVSRPTELRVIKDKLSNKELVYFLHKIAIESVMDTTLVFDGTNDLANERLRVCQLLIELDAENTNIYQAEIIEINKRLLLQKRIQEVEQSKIYVDRENIKKKSTNEIRDNFNRYISFLKEKIKPNTLNYKQQTLFNVDRLKDLITVISSGETKKYIVWELPEDEMSQLLEKMFIEVRDTYVSNVPYGLNAFLSVRIRHGTLTAQIRNTLETYSLVTQKNHKTSHYKFNEYWNDQFLSIADLVKSKNLTMFLANLQTELAKFSFGIDSIIQEIISDWIQVKKFPDEKGEFDFTYRAIELDILSSRVNEKTQLEDFIEGCLTIFEDRLNTNLERLRHKFSSICKDRFVELLDNLQVQIETLGKDFDVDTGDLSVSITNARTSLINVIDRITKWFKLSESTAKEPFILEEAIKIGENSVRTLVNDFRADILGNIPDISIPGKHLNGFNDIFFILFENIVRHSAEKIIHPKAILSIKLLDNILKIEVENDISPDIQTDLVEEKLRIIRKRIAEGEYVSGVANEGGSGFYKIFNILNYSFAPNKSLEFGFIDDKKFFVRFEISIDAIGAK